MAAIAEWHEVSELRPTSYKKMLHGTDARMGLCWGVVHLLTQRDLGHGHGDSRERLHLHACMLCACIHVSLQVWMSERGWQLI